MDFFDKNYSIELKDKIKKMSVDDEVVDIRTFALNIINSYLNLDIESDFESFHIRGYKDYFLKFGSKEKFDLKDFKKICSFYVLLIDENSFLNNALGVGDENADLNRYLTIEEIDDLNKSKINRMNHFVSRLSNNGVYRKFLKYTELSDDLDFKIKEYERNIKKLEVVKRSISEYIDKASLAEFANGFYNDFRSKRIEKWLNTVTIFGFGLVALFIPFCLAYDLLMNDSGYVRSFFLTGFEDGSWYVFSISVFSIEFLVLYFFRITVVNGNNLKSQIIQLRLRLSVSRFLSNYLNEQTVANKNEGTLSRFESLVFKDISQEGAKQVSAFDDIEKIARVVSMIAFNKGGGQETARNQSESQQPKNG